MVGTVYETETVETPAVEAAEQDQATTQEMPRLGTQSVTLPLKTLGTVKTIDLKVVSFPARRVTIEGARVVSLSDLMEDLPTSRPTADEVDG